MKLLVKFPTRSRPERFMRTLKLYFELLERPADAVFLITLDSDDETMAGAEPEITALASAHSTRAVVRYGVSKNKVDAINRDMEGEFGPDGPWDVLLLASDDMTPVARGYDSIISTKMAQHFPDGDGVLWFYDGFIKHLNTLVCCGRAYYARFGFIYHPAYKSFFCDDEFQDTASRSGKQVHIPQVIIRHEHPSNMKGAGKDALYIRNDAPWFDDMHTYAHRRQYDYDLSILMCCLKSRMEMATPLISNLLFQIDRVRRSHGVRVELLTDIDNREVTIGEKRNRLLSKAKGRFACFVDDDDALAPDLLQLWAPHIGADSTVDCLSLNGLLIADGEYIAPFEHSIKYSDWNNDPTLLVRCPNHWNPVRTEFARRAGFPLLSFAEDREYSRRLREMGVLRSEAEIPEVVYHYLFREKSSSSSNTVRAAAANTAAKLNLTKGHMLEKVIHRAI